jgi:mannose-1-phosphate guanylyltransferase
VVHMNLSKQCSEPDPIRQRHNLAYFFVRSLRSKAETIPLVPDIPRAGCPISHGNRWGVILAGGDGVRLRPLTNMICGDDRPKQFCPLLGERTLLGQTLQRSEQSIPQEHLLVSLSAHHSKWYSREADLRPSQRVVQPENRGTAPAIVHSLLSLAQLDAQALVAILPSDHHYSGEQLFATALESAFETAALRKDTIVLLGARPDYPEVEYGWIEPGLSIGPIGSELFRVRSFQEKPAIDVAENLLDQGFLWNTFVMVGNVRAYLQMVQAALPYLLDVLAQARMWAGQEVHIEDSLYERIPPVNFSGRVLGVHPEHLTVLRMNDVGWTDLGNPERAHVTARQNGYEPGWVKDWGRMKPVLSERPEKAAAAA